MKYIKLFESDYQGVHRNSEDDEYFDKLKKKAEEYDKYAGKYVVIAKDDKILVGIFMYLVISRLYAKINIFAEPEVSHRTYTEVFHLNDFNVLDIADDEEGVFRKYREILSIKNDSEKYNI